MSSLQIAKLNWKYIFVSIAGGAGIILIYKYIKKKKYENKQNGKGKPSLLLKEEIQHKSSVHYGKPSIPGPNCLSSTKSSEEETSDNESEVNISFDVILEPVCPEDIHSQSVSINTTDINSNSFNIDCETNAEDNQELETCEKEDTNLINSFNNNPHEVRSPNDFNNEENQESFELIKSLETGNFRETPSINQTESETDKQKEASISPSENEIKKSVHIQKDEDSDIECVNEPDEDSKGPGSGDNERKIQPMKSGRVTFSYHRNPSYYMSMEQNGEASLSTKSHRKVLSYSRNESYYKSMEDENQAKEISHMSQVSENDEKIAHGNSPDTEGIPQQSEDDMETDPAIRQESPESQATGIIRDENDIVIIPEDKATADVTVSTIDIVHPHSKERISFGCKFETTIEKKKETYFARHCIADANNNQRGLAYNSRLRDGYDIQAVNGITTEGMANALIVSYFQALTINEGKPLKLTILQEKEDEYGKTQKENFMLTIHFSIGVTDLKVRDVDHEPTSSEKPIDIRRHNGKAFQEEACWIKHNKTEKYICFNGSGQLFLEVLKQNVQTFIFKNQLFAGTDKVDGSEFWNQPVIIFAWYTPTSSIIEFIVSTGVENVGLAKMDNVSQSKATLSDKDPRYFYHIQPEGSSDDYFKSVLVRDHYLGYDESTKKLCLVEVKDTKELYKHDNIKFTMHYKTDKTDIPSNSDKITTI